MLNAICCCLHRRRESDEHIDQVDERTHLIPSPPELLSPNYESTPSASAIEHQRIKDRMGNIVRSKESKMVNVNARLPFNLHNHASSSNPHPSSSSQSLSSSSRSLSHTDGRVPTGIAHSNSHIQVHVGAPLSALSSPVASTSRPPVFHQASPSRSSSMASRETGDGSVVRQREQPILGLKLVRIPFPENMESSGRRGRKKKKISEEASDGELASPSAKTPTAHDAHFDLDIPTGDAATPRPPRQVLAAAEISISPASTSSVDGGSEEDQVRRQKARKINEARTFAIRDDGPLSISWGD